MSTDLMLKEGYEITKSVCSDIRYLISSFKRDGIIRKYEIKAIKDKLDAARTMQKQANVVQMHGINLKQIHTLFAQYDLEKMNPKEVGIFYSQLEKMTDRLEKIIDDYMNGLI